MSTRSAIIEQIEDGTFRGIYCHFDGCLSGVGATLLEHYQGPEKVHKLIDLGDISILDERVDPIGPHSFEKREEGTTVAYTRDRGETGLEPKTGKTWKQVASQIVHNGYAYCFMKGKWHCNGKELKPNQVQTA